MISRNQRGCNLGAFSVLWQSCALLTPWWEDNLCTLLCYNYAYKNGDLGEKTNIFKIIHLCLCACVRMHTYVCLGVHVSLCAVVACVCVCECVLMYQTLYPSSGNNASVARSLCHTHCKTFMKGISLNMMPCHSEIPLCRWLIWYRHAQTWVSHLSLIEEGQ